MGQLRPSYCGLGYWVSGHQSSTQQYIVSKWSCARVLTVGAHIEGRRQALLSDTCTRKSTYSTKDTEALSAAPVHASTTSAAALVHFLLTVASGLPFVQREALSEVNQRPLVGDLLPVGGHVVVENPAPQPQLSKELQLSATHPKKKEQMTLHDQVNEFVEEQPVKTDLPGNSIDITSEEKYAPAEEVHLESELNEFADKGDFQSYLEPNVEIIETVEQDEPQEGSHKARNMTLSSQLWSWSL
ncbi:hypothetical protein WMY93_028617 [Mugilogobius chulae]|uniref:Uncharacterized protein n=1 Tax=Mugilogobius chulae TaxID=88201 RepID=A0AAW0MNY9_9GOBI